MKKLTIVLFAAIWISALSRAYGFESDYISVAAEGSGPDVILIHGFACSPEVWSGLAEETGSGFRLHLVAVAGFAGSAAPTVVPESYLKTLRDEVIRYIDEEQLDKPALMGHSMGGFLSLLVASAASSKVDKIVVVDALPFYSLLFNPAATVEMVRPQALAIEAQLSRLDDAGFEQQAKSSVATLTKSDEKRELLVQWSKTSDRKTYARYLRELMTYDARPELNTITCPVTVLYAYDEAMGVPQSQLDQFYSAAYADSETASLKPIPGSYHFIMWDQPEAFYGAVKQLLVPASVPNSVSEDAK